LNSNEKTYKALLENVNCNLCGAHENYEVIYPPVYHQANPDKIEESFRSSGDEVLIDQLVRCRQCGLQYLTPRLQQSVIINSYSNGSDEIFVSQAGAREATFNRCLDVVEQAYPKKGRILDIGTAGGSFLSVAKKRGWEVSGCEPNRWLTQWCKANYGIEVFPGTIFDMKVADASCDVVTLWDVLEHVPDPDAVLKECRRILKPGGLLVINYPDISSSVARLMGRKWVFLLSIHLYYFTPQTIKKMLIKNDFKPFKLKKHWQALQLDYIFMRIKPYIPWLSDFGRKTVSKLNMKHVNVPYWVGQMLILSYKK
jgi:2-polyprenyl-3-methyl-5-hydroxy-6-metoxy-1,4-benzoquinol methylase